MQRPCTVLMLLLGLLSLAHGLPAAGNDDAGDKPSPDEQAVIQLVNAERKKKELEALRPNPLLTRIARSHSRNMAATGEFNHVLDGRGPGDRAKQAGYRYARIGENIAWGSALTPKEAMSNWMKSEGHRKNILSEEYRAIGVGIAASKSGERYYTQVFGAARRPARKD